MTDIPPSIRVCECLDGPYNGYVVRVGVRARFIPLHRRLRRTACHQVRTMTARRRQPLHGHEQRRQHTTLPTTSPVSKGLCFRLADERHRPRASRRSEWTLGGALLVRGVIVESAANPLAAHRQVSQTSSRSSIHRRGMRNLQRKRARRWRPVYVIRQFLHKL